MVGEVDPVDEDLVVDFPSDIEGGSGDGPAPGPLASQCPAGIASDLCLGSLAEYPVEVLGEDG